MTGHRPDPAMLRSRYLDMTDPHDGNDGSGPPSIRVVSYLGDFDDYYELNLLGPYETATSRDTDLQRIQALPGMHGKLEFEPCSLSLVEVGHTRYDAEREDVERATTFREFMAGFDHDDDWLTEDDE